MYATLSSGNVVISNGLSPEMYIAWDVPGKSERLNVVWSGFIEILTVNCCAGLDESCTTTEVLSTETPLTSKVLPSASMDAFAID